MGHSIDIDTQEFVFHGVKFRFTLRHEIDDTPGFRESDDWIYIERWLEAREAGRRVAFTEAKFLRWIDDPAHPAEWARINRIYVSSDELKE